MPRISGVEIPENKRIEAALTYIYGIGGKNAKKVLEKANINPDKRAKDLSDEETAKLQKAIETIPTEGTLRKIVSENIKRLKQIGTYRGLRHSQGLPSRGQRTRSNARTKRGKRQTVGALKKDLAQRLEAARKEKDKKEK
jgi:small subunit ribosomal protein S13